MFENSLILAQETAGNAGSNSNGSMLTFIVPLIVIMAVMMFLNIRSQKKQREKQQKMFNAVVKGTRVRTIGGFIGTVVEVKDDSVMLELNAKNAPVELAKSAIATVLNGENDAASAQK